MKRIPIIILIFCAALTMLTSCSTNETGQLDIDPNMNVTAVTSYVSIQTEAKQEIPDLKKISDESTEENTDLTMEYADTEMQNSNEN